MSDFYSKRPTLSRWVDIVLYGLAGSFFAAYFCLPVTNLIQGVLEELFGSPLQITVQFVCSLLILILLGAVHRSIRFRWKHFECLRSYPPLVISIFIGLLLYEIWPRLDSGILRSNSEEAIPFYLLPSSYVLVLVLIGILQKTTRDAKNTVTNVDEGDGKHPVSDQHSWDDYEEWLANDDPIDQQKKDWFGHREIAQACYNRLIDGGHSIALHGPYGAGKTTICRMVERLSIESEQRFIFATVSCWGFESSASAQQHILDAILSVVCERVDSLRLQGLPKRYIDAIADHSKPAASILRLFQTAGNPVELLSAFEPVLKATNQRLILVIEDLDRNGTNFDRGDIVALLNRLRKIKNISVILAMAPDHQLDFLKVCDHFEPVPALSKLDISKRLDEYRTLLLEHYSPSFLLDKLEPFEADEFHMAQLERNPSHRPVVTSLSNIIIAPRQFKVIVRAVRSQWEALCGEVRIDDLIVINALRHVEPEAFYFLIRNHARFKAIVGSSNQNSNYGNEVRDKLLEELKVEWLSVTDGLTSDLRSVQELIRFVDRNSGPIFGDSSIGTVRKQSLTDDTRGYIYARRLFSGRVSADECLDQRILGLIQEAKSNREAALELAKIITFNLEGSYSYLAFHESLSFQNHFVLISCVYEVMRDLLSKNSSRDEAPGFRAVSQVYAHQVPEEVNDWLRGELEKCIPNALWLMTDIFHHWCRKSNTRFVQAGSLSVPIQAALIRQAICEKIKSCWEQMSPNEIAKCFEGAPSYTLFHIIFTVDYEETTEYMLNADSDWQWMKAYLWEATKASAEIMLPQILLLLMKDSIRRSYSYSYDLDENRLGLFIDASREEFFSFVAGCSRLDITKDPSIREMLKVALAYCQEQLSEKNTNI